MPRYSKEFKKEALALLESSGQSVHAISKRLGISDKSLAQWKEEVELSDKLQGKDVRQELKRLKRENERLRMERDILKKATAFFARESG
jgi:transposase